MKNPIKKTIEDLKIEKDSMNYFIKLARDKGLYEKYSLSVANAAINLSVARASSPHNRDNYEISSLIKTHFMKDFEDVGLKYSERLERYQEMELAAEELSNLVIC